MYVPSVHQSTMNDSSMQEPSRREVWRMFDRIAPHYDRLNRILSFGIDKGWRRKVAALLPRRENLEVLDLATGTADQLLALCSARPDIARGVGMDLAEEMLAVGRKKIAESPHAGTLTLETGDAMRIPAADATFDAVTISFGIRNVMDVGTALADMARVLRPGGRLLILEFSLPTNPVIRAGHLFYLRHVLPRVGGWVSGDAAAYRYLNETVESFPCGDRFCDLMCRAGLVQVKALPLTFGIASIYCGDKPHATTDHAAG